MANRAPLLSLLRTPRSEGRGPRTVSRLPVSPVAVFILAVGLAVSTLVALQLRRNISHDQSQRLAERAQQTTNLFSTVAQGIAAVLTTGSVVADSTDGDAGAFRRAVEARLAPTLLSNATLFDTRGGLRMLASTGASKPVLIRTFTPRNRALLLKAARTGTLVVVVRRRYAGADVVGLADAARPGGRHVTYAEVSIPRALSFGNLKGVDFGFYLDRETPQTLLATNTTHLPIQGHRLVIRLGAPGLSAQPVLVYGEKRSVGFDSFSPWLLLAAGGLASLVVAGQFEAMRRRRDTALGLVADLELKNAELDLQSAINKHQALHDALTGLPNRTLFRDRIEQELRRDHRAGGHTAVILIDLDRFKEVNDTLGHQSGDVLLHALSERLSATVRATDTVARLGGDEFGVVAGSLASPDDALAIAAKLGEAIGGPAEVAGISVEVDASLGIALHPEHGDDVDTLMRHADIALYRSKAIHAPALYDVEHDHYSPVRLQLVADLRAAIEAGQIVVHYQPQAPTATGAIGTVEALVRWNHPDLGVIPPGQFVPLAEQTGMIRPLTRFVLETALAQSRSWTDRGWDISMAVNVCARDLLDVAFPDEVLTCLRESEVDPRQLELEISESTILTDPARALEVMNVLRAHGVCFAIDDFGAGHSSLAYLKRLPVQVLKIDKSFVLGMVDNEDDAVIVQSTINLGHNLRLKVVAEGVETAEILDRLTDLECDVIQGFHLARPLPPKELEALFGPPEEPRRRPSRTGPPRLPQRS